MKYDLCDFGDGAMWDAIGGDELAREAEENNRKIDARNAEGFSFGWQPTRDHEND